MTRFNRWTTAAFALVVAFSLSPTTAYAQTCPEPEYTVSHARIHADGYEAWQVAPER